MSKSYEEVVDQLAGYLEYLRDEGARTVELTPGALAAIRRPLDAPPASPAPVAAEVAVNVEAPIETPGPSGDVDLDAVAAEIAGCTKCGLCESRTKTVPGQGSLRPEILFVGEGPGADEDRQGLAFVGRAGQLLTKMIEAMGFRRDEVFIANVVKCRPPGNRTPLPDEMATCLPYLARQIAVLQPKVIVAMGATAVKGLLNTTSGITNMRGNWKTFEGIDVMPTFHPAYLLRDPSKKREAWADLQSVLERLGRQAPPRA
jgi:DNA polymerase